MKIYNEFHKEKTWYIDRKKNAGYVENGGLVLPGKPELYKTEKAWKARCKKLGIEVQDEL